MDPYPQTLDLIDLIVRYISVILDVLFQKWRMRKLPSLSESGERPPDDTTVVVTGPTSGIGTETAAEFARRGCHAVMIEADNGRRGLSAGEMSWHGMEHRREVSDGADDNSHLSSSSLSSS